MLKQTLLRYHMAAPTASPTAAVTKALGVGFNVDYTISAGYVSSRLTSPALPEPAV
jgi:hypothetical protein